MTKQRFHYILDMTNCNDKILDKEIIKDFIIKMAQELKMTLLHGPVVLEGVPENPGITGFAIVDFSHISIHSFTNNEVFIDIFSCKTYDKSKVVQMCKDNFANDNSEFREKEVWWGE